MSTPMLATHPAELAVDLRVLAEAIDALNACAQTCASCADACLSEKSVADLTTCVSTNLDCADVCAAVARVLTRQTAYDATTTKALVEACAQFCRSCAEECGSHASMHEHCAVCAEVCRRCERACRDLVAAMG